MHKRSLKNIRENMFWIQSLALPCDFNLQRLGHENKWVHLGICQDVSAARARMDWYGDCGTTGSRCSKSLRTEAMKEEEEEEVQTINSKGPTSITFDLINIIR